jgi:hypothetical protein
MKTHTFHEKLSQEKEESVKIDVFLTQWYHVIPTSLELDKRGIDRILIDKEDLTVSKIDYKHDWRASETGNAFIETCSVYKEGECKKHGWVYTGGADDIYYNVVGEETIYVVPKSLLITITETRWEDEYRTASARNPGYVSHGILVPLEEIAEISSQIIHYGGAYE